MRWRSENKANRDVLIQRAGREKTRPGWIQDRALRMDEDDER